MAEDNFFPHPDMDDVSPPPYKESFEEDPNELCEPTTFIQHDTAVYAETTDSLAVYHLSRDVSAITSSTKTVDFERIEKTVKRTSRATDEPVIQSRPRHIYTLNYMTTLPGPFAIRVDGWSHPRVFIKSESRRTAGHMAIRHSRFNRSRNDLKIVPMETVPSQKALRFKKDATPLFRIQPGEDGKHLWVDENGKPVAIEESVDEVHKLIITVSLPRKMVDAMVGLWCGRIWESSDEKLKPLHEGMEGGESNSNKLQCSQLMIIST